MGKLMFYEIAEGQFADQAQREFEEAQNIVHQRGVTVKIAMEITVHPESRERKGTADVEFKTKLQAPPRKSIRYLTEVSKEGQLIDSGHRQTHLPFGDHKKKENSSI